MASTYGFTPFHAESAQMLSGIGSSGDDFYSWLNGQPTETQTLFQSTQAANPGSMVFDPDNSYVKLPSSGVSQNSLLAVGAAGLLMALFISSLGRR